MCGVVGYFSNKPRGEHLTSVQRLLVASKIRGLHAFGLALLHQDGAVETLKAHRLPELVSFLEGLKGNPPQAVIAHNRYSTSGDWQDHRNNQPIDLGQIQLVFNGVISMKTRPEYEQEFGRSYTTDNDGEIFARKVLEGENWSGFVKQGKFSFAGLFLWQGSVFGIRNAQRPLWYHSPEPGTVFAASTADIFRRAIGVKNPMPFPIGQPVRLDLIC